MTVSLVNTMVRVLLLAVDTRVPVPLHTSDSTVTLVSRLTHTHTHTHTHTARPPPHYSAVVLGRVQCITYLLIPFY